MRIQHIIATLFLVMLAIPVHAQEYLGWTDQTYVGSTIYLGNNTFKLEAENLGAFIDAPTTISLAEVYMYRTNAPNGRVYGVLADNFSTTTGAYTVIATSTDSYASSTFTTSATLFTFSFPDVAVDEDTWFVLVSDASSTASNIRYNINLYGGSNVGGTWTDIAGVNGTSFAMARYTSSGYTAQETGGTSTTTVNVSLFTDEEKALLMVFAIIFFWIGLLLFFRNVVLSWYERK